MQNEDFPYPIKHGFPKYTHLIFPKRIVPRHFRQVVSRNPRPSKQVPARLKIKGEKYTEITIY